MILNNLRYNDNSKKEACLLFVSAILSMNDYLYPYTEHKVKFTLQIPSSHTNVNSENDESSNSEKEFDSTEIFIKLLKKELRNFAKHTEEAKNYFTELARANGYTELKFDHLLIKNSSQITCDDILQSITDPVEPGIGENAFVYCFSPRCKWQNKCLLKELPINYLINNSFVIANYEPFIYKHNENNKQKLYMLIIPAYEYRGESREVVSQFTSIIDRILDDVRLYCQETLPLMNARVTKKKNEETDSGAKDSMDSLGQEVSEFYYTIIRPKANSKEFEIVWSPITDYFRFLLFSDTDTFNEENSVLLNHNEDNEYVKSKTKLLNSPSSSKVKPSKYQIEQLKNILKRPSFASRLFFDSPDDSYNFSLAVYQLCGFILINSERESFKECDFGILEQYNYNTSHDNFIENVKELTEKAKARLQDDKIPLGITKKSLLIACIELMAPSDTHLKKNQSLIKSGSRDSRVNKVSSQNLESKEKICDEQNYEKKKSSVRNKNFKKKVRKDIRPKKNFSHRSDFATLSENNQENVPLLTEKSDLENIELNKELVNHNQSEKCEDKELVNHNESEKCEDKELVNHNESEKCEDKKTIQAESTKNESISNPLFDIQVKMNYPQIYTTSGISRKQFEEECFIKKEKIKTRKNIPGVSGSAEPVTNTINDNTKTGKKNVQIKSKHNLIHSESEAQAEFTQKKFKKNSNDTRKMKKLNCSSDKLSIVESKKKMGKNNQNSVEKTKTKLIGIDEKHLEEDSGKKKTKNSLNLKKKERSDAFFKKTLAEQVVYE